MRGMSQLVAIRRKGLKPEGMVWIYDKPTADWQTDWLNEESSPTICTHGDELHAIDLRALVGLSVSVEGVDGERVRSLARGAKEAGASAIVATFGEQGLFWTVETGKWIKF
jgi:hypothetical protein